MLRNLLPLCIVVLLAGCDHAMSNTQTLNTSDCGVTWRVIPVGTTIPTNAGNRCGYNTSLPNYPMQGDNEFKAQFEGNVLVTVRISYDYEIDDPIKFLNSAKFLGRQSDMAADSSQDANKSKSFETAENQVIDIRMREAVTSSTGTRDIVEFNPSKFEDELLVAANKALEERGVKILSLSFVMIPEEQTRMAIDAATAQNVYRQKNMAELGEKLAIARAGAARIVVESSKP